MLNPYRGKLFFFDALVYSEHLTSQTLQAAFFSELEHDSVSPRGAADSVLRAASEPVPDGPTPSAATAGSRSFAAAHRLGIDGPSRPSSGCGVVAVFL